MATTKPCWEFWNFIQFSGNYCCSGVDGLDRCVVYLWTTPWSSGKLESWKSWQSWNFIASFQLIQMHQNSSKALTTAATQHDHSPTDTVKLNDYANSLRRLNNTPRKNLMRKNLSIGAIWMVASIWLGEHHRRPSAPLNRRVNCWNIEGLQTCSNSLRKTRNFGTNSLKDTHHNLIAGRRWIRIRLLTRPALQIKSYGLFCWS